MTEKGADPIVLPRWVLLAVAASVLVAVGSLALSLVFVTNQRHVERTANGARVAADTANATAAQIIQTRTESRRIACEKDLKIATAHNNLVLYFVALGEKDGSSPKLIADFRDKNLVPVPDCTPAGIAAFYAGQGGTSTPVVGPITTPTTVKPKKHAATTTSHATTSSTGSTTTTIRSSPTTTPTPCTGVTLPGGLPCL